MRHLVPSSISTSFLLKVAKILSAQIIIPSSEEITAKGVLQHKVLNSIKAAAVLYLERICRERK